MTGPRFVACLGGLFAVAVAVGYAAAAVAVCGPDCQHQP